jgi:hypothetical protein
VFVCVRVCSGVYVGVCALEYSTIPHLVCARACARAFVLVCVRVCFRGMRVDLGMEDVATCARTHLRRCRNVRRCVRMCACAYVCVRVCACVRASERACVGAFVRGWLGGCVGAWVRGCMHQKESTSEREQGTGEYCVCVGGGVNITPESDRSVQ